MRVRAAILILMLVVACGSEPASVEIDGQRCDAVALAVLGAVLPGWNVHAVVVDRVGGDTGWALASDDVGAPMLKRWPDGPSLALAELGALDDFSLLPGRGDDESWLLLDRPDGPQVWRLAPDGEMKQAPAPGAFAGPGAWTYGLLLAEDSVLLLAATSGVPSSDLRFGFARLDADTLVATSLGPNLHFSELCRPIGQVPCSFFGATQELIEVDVEAVSEPGAMPGAAAVLSVDFGSRMSPGIVTLQAIDHGEGQAGEVIVRMPGLVAASADDELRGVLASDGAYLYTSMLTSSMESGSERVGFARARLDDRWSDSYYPLFDGYGDGPGLQLGTSVFLPRFIEGRFEVARLLDGELRPERLTLDLPMHTRMRSAGREQWFAVPPSGPALRIGASCE